MEFSEVVRRRRMVRNYTSDPVSSDTVTRLLQIARRAPSAGFSQGQSFVAVTDTSTRLRIAEIAGEPHYVQMGFDPWISRAPVIVVVCTSEKVYRTRYREPDKLGPQGEIAWPVPYWWVDAGCSLMLLLLAAVDEGLAAGFCGVADPDAVRSILGIPAGVDPIGLVTIGHIAPDRRSGSLARGWKTETEVLHREHWGAG